MCIFHVLLREDQNIVKDVYSVENVKNATSDVRHTFDIISTAHLKLSGYNEICHLYRTLVLSENVTIDL